MTSMKNVNALIVFLISSLAITGISFIDGKIWEIIFFSAGLAAYALVGVLFSFGIISTTKQGSEAYSLAFFLIVLIGFGIYKALDTFRNWILSWPLAAKIVVPSAIGTIIVVLIVLKIKHSIISKKQLSEGDKDGKE